MTAVLEPDVCEPVVSLGWITRQAESQIAQLCAVDRARIAKALLRPLPQSRCTLVGSLAKYRVYHFRASKTLRVSYRPTEQGLCIVHVGKHSEFNRFAQHFAGEPPVNLVPLQESSVMKNYQHVAKSTPAKSVPAQPNVPPTAPVAGDEELMLVESLRELIGKAVAPRHEALASDWAARLDKVRKEMEQSCQECGQRLAQHEGRINGLANDYRGKLGELCRQVEETGKNVQALAAELAKSRLEVDGRFDAQRQSLEELRREASDQVIQANAVRTEAEGRIAALDGRLERESQEIDRRLDSVAQSIERQHQAATAKMTQFEERLSALDKTVGSLSETFDGLAKTAQEQQAAIAGLAAAFGQVSAELTRLTPPVKKPRWRQLWDWVRTIGWARAWSALPRQRRGRSPSPQAAGTLCRPASLGNART